MKLILDLFTFIVIFINKNRIIYGIYKGFVIWSKEIMPTFIFSYLFSKFILSSVIFRKYNNKYTLLFILLLTGSPGNMVIIKELYKSHKINDKELNLLIVHSMYLNPFFIIKFSSIYVLLSMYLANILVFIINFRHININITFSNSFNLIESINTSVKTSINILGFILFFSGILSIFDNYSITSKIIISGILEISNFSSLISRNSISVYIVLFFFNFGGLSLLLQIKSILKDTLIDYYKLIKVKIIIFLLSAVIISCITLFT